MTLICPVWPTQVSPPECRWQLVFKTLFFWEETSASLSLTSLSTKTQAHLSHCPMNLPIQRTRWNTVGPELCGTKAHRNQQNKVFRPWSLERINPSNKWKSLFSWARSWTTMLIICNKVTIMQFIASMLGWVITSVNSYNSSCEVASMVQRN